MSLPKGNVSEKQVGAMLDVIVAMADVVRKSPRGLPSGELYATVMGIMSLETYERVIALMVEAGAIERHGHWLCRKGGL